MAMISRDDLSEAVHDAREEFTESGQKKFAIRKLCTYDEITYDIMKVYVEKFNTWVNSHTSKEARVVTKRRAVNYLDPASDESHLEVYYDIVLVYTGPLP